MHIPQFVFSAVFCLFSLSSFAQLNPEFQLVKIKKNEVASTVISSLYASPLIANSEELDDNYEILKIEPLSGSEYEIIFQPTIDFTGHVDLIIEYYDVGTFPGFPSVQYASIKHEVKTSLVQANNEVILSQSSNVLIDPLVNDENSDGTLSIEQLVFVDGGEASLNANGEVSFNFNEDSTIGFVSYIAEDELGTGDEGLIRIIRTQTTENAGIEFSVNNKESIDFYLGGLTFEIAQDANHGTLETNDGQTYSYTPNSSYSGIESIQFQNDLGQICEIEIQVVEKEISNSFVNNDYIYTSINESIVFDVFENDLRSEYEVVDHSPELVYLGNGNFEYAPDYNENGANIFYYKVFTGLYFHTAQIFISIDDYAPYGSDVHSFNVYDGTNFVIQHNAPITGYSFEILSDAQHGLITIKNAGELLDSECATSQILEESVVEYFAEPGFEGIDAFELNYCTPGGNCHIVKIEANIITNTNNDCNCQVGCVWPGDFNNDGIVNLRDLMTLGVNIGEKGIERSTQNGNEWAGSTSDTWGFQALDSNADLMHMDANGDGYISIDDATAVYENFGLQNRLTSKEVHAISSIPIILSTTQTEVDSGEWLYLDVSLGSEEFPVIDFYGLSFEFNLNPGLIDESTACFTPAKDSFAYYDAPYADITQVSAPGNISVGVTRLTGVPVSGSGYLGILKFIVTEELDGFRGEDGKLEIRMDLDDALAYDMFGNATALKSNEVSVLLDTSSNTKDFVLNAKMYPNPTSEILNIEANEAIDKINIIDASGQLIKSIKTNESNLSIPVGELSDGLYFFNLISGTTDKTIKVGIFNQN